MQGNRKISSVILESSRNSFINSLCNFVNDVEKMNQVVLVPSRLSDFTSNPAISECSNFQELYDILNRLKDELVLSRVNGEAGEADKQRLVLQPQRCSSLNPPQSATSIDSSKYASSCSDDDGFCSLSSDRQSSPASDDDLSTDCDSDYSEAGGDDKSEYFVNLLRLHIQGIESILSKFSSYSKQVSEGYQATIS